MYFYIYIQVHFSHQEEAIVHTRLTAELYIDITYITHILVNLKIKFLQGAVAGK